MPPLARHGQRGIFSRSWLARKNHTAAMPAAIPDGFTEPSPADAEIKHEKAPPCHANAPTLRRVAPTPSRRREPPSNARKRQPVHDRLQKSDPPPAATVLSTPKNPRQKISKTPL